MATSSSDLNCYRIPKVSMSSNNDYYEGDISMNCEVLPVPVLHIPGAPRLTHFHVLNDKRHILTKDSENNVALYDVLKVSCNLGVKVHLFTLTRILKSRDSSNPQYVLAIIFTFEYNLIFIIRQSN